MAGAVIQAHVGWDSIGWIGSLCGHRSRPGGMPRAASRQHIEPLLAAACCAVSGLGRLLFGDFPNIPGQTLYPSTSACQAPVLP